MYDVQSIASRIKKEAKTQYKQEKKFEQEHGIINLQGPAERQQHVQAVYCL